MASANWTQDEVRDLIRFLSSQNDFMADMMSRAPLGGGLFSAEAFQPQKTYVPTPIIDRIRGIAAYAPTTFEGGIAQGILAGQLPSTILAELKGTDEEALRQIIPYTRTVDDPADPTGQAKVDVIDWDRVEKEIANTFDSYMGEQQELSQYQQETDPNTGSIRYYEETPSELTERFRGLGLPLPTEEYGQGREGLPSMQMFRDQNLFDPGIDALDDQVARQQLLVNEAQQRARQREATRGETTGGQPAAGPSPYSNIRQPGLMEALGTGGPKEWGEATRRTLGDVGDKLGDAWNWIDKQNFGQNDIADFWTGLTGGGGGEQAGGDITNPSARGGLPWFDRFLDEAKEVARSDSDNRLTRTLDSLKEDRQRAQVERGKAWKSTFNDDWMYGMGRELAARDSGRSPLTDTLQQMMGSYGLDSGFRPQMETVGDQQFRMADPQNPNYRDNVRAAYFGMFGLTPEEIERRNRVSRQGIKGPEARAAEIRRMRAARGA